MLLSPGSSQVNVTELCVVSACRFMGCAGAATVGVAVAVNSSVGVCVTVGVGVAVVVGVAVDVAVDVAVGADATTASNCSLHAPGPP